MKLEIKPRLHIRRFILCNIYAYSRLCKVKLKCTLVQALRFCTDHTTHRGSRGIALRFHDYGTRRG